MSQYSEESQCRTTRADMAIVKMSPLIMELLYAIKSFTKSDDIGFNAMKLYICNGQLGARQEKNEKAY